jgi:Mor family transcriptional regulator
MTDKTDMFGDDLTLDPEKVLEHLDVEVPKRRWDSMMRRLMLAVTDALGKHLSPDQVEQLAPNVVLSICDQVGGHICYFPRGVALRAALRDIQLYADWKHRNVPPYELATKYQLAVQTVYEIIKRQRLLARQKEPDLFGFGEGKKG